MPSGAASWSSVLGFTARTLAGRQYTRPCTPTSDLLSLTDNRRSSSVWIQTSERASQSRHTTPWGLKANRRRVLSAHSTGHLRNLQYSSSLEESDPDSGVLQEQAVEEGAFNDARLDVPVRCGGNKEDRANVLIAGC